jgi:hypothetical protein
VQSRIEVNLQCGQNVFMGMQVCLNFRAPMGGKLARRGTDKGYFSGHYKQATFLFGSLESPIRQSKSLSKSDRFDDTTPQGIAPEPSASQ